jgi:hypothetical protein
MNRWMRTAAAAAMMAGGVGGIGCTGTGAGKSATADPVARGAAPDGGCSTCPGGGCDAGGHFGGKHGTDRIGPDDRLANLYDPCWPDRYAYMARQEVLAPFAIQVHNAEILEQTIWNYHFVAESDALTAAGLERLDYLARRRPSPDPQLYLQTARDVNYDPAKPDKFVSDRLQLNEKRAQAIQRYLAAQTASRPMNFVVTVNDAVDPSISAVGPANAVRGLTAQYRSGISGGIGAGANVQGIGGGGGGSVTGPGAGNVPSGGSPTGGR